MKYILLYIYIFFFILFVINYIMNRMIYDKTDKSTYIYLNFLFIRITYTFHCMKSI